MATNSRKSNLKFGLILSCSFLSIDPIEAVEIAGGVVLGIAQAVSEENFWGSGSSKKAPADRATSGDAGPVVGTPVTRGGGEMHVGVPVSRAPVRTDAPPSATRSQVEASSNVDTASDKLSAAVESFYNDVYKRSKSIKVDGTESRADALAGHNGTIHYSNKVRRFSLDRLVNRFKRRLHTEKTVTQEVEKAAAKVTKFMDKVEPDNFFSEPKHLAQFKKAFADLTRVDSIASKMSITKYSFDGLRVAGHAGVVAAGLALVPITGGASHVIATAYILSLHEADYFYNIVQMRVEHNVETVRNKMIDTVLDKAEGASAPAHALATLFKSAASDPALHTALVDRMAERVVNGKEAVTAKRSIVDRLTGRNKPKPEKVTTLSERIKEMEALFDHMPVGIEGKILTEARESIEKEILEQALTEYSKPGKNIHEAFDGINALSHITPGERDGVMEALIAKSVPSDQQVRLDREIERYSKASASIKFERKYADALHSKWLREVTSSTESMTEYVTNHVSDIGQIADIIVDACRRRSDHNWVRRSSEKAKIDAAHIKEYVTIALDTRGSFTHKEIIRRGLELMSKLKSPDVQNVMGKESIDDFINNSVKEALAIRSRVEASESPDHVAYSHLLLSIDAAKSLVDVTAALNKFTTTFNRKQDQDEVIDVGDVLDKLGEIYSNRYYKRNAEFSEAVSKFISEQLESAKSGNVLELLADALTRKLADLPQGDALRAKLEARIDAATSANATDNSKYAEFLSRIKGKLTTYKTKAEEAVRRHAEAIARSVAQLKKGLEEADDASALAQYKSGLTTLEQTGDLTPEQLRELNLQLLETGDALIVKLKDESAPATAETTETYKTLKGLRNEGLKGVIKNSTTVEEVTELVTKYNNDPDFFDGGLGPEVAKKAIATYKDKANQADTAFKKALSDFVEKGITDANAKEDPAARTNTLKFIDRLLDGVFSTLPDAQALKQTLDAARIGRTSTGGLTHAEEEARLNEAAATNKHDINDATGDLHNIHEQQLHHQQAAQHATTDRHSALSGSDPLSDPAGEVHTGSHVSSHGGTDEGVHGTDVHSGETEGEIEHQHHLAEEAAHALHKLHEEEGDGGGGDGADGM